MTNCARCHGDTGHGDGPDAARMVPRPRDLTTGTYKFRTTASGSPPTDEDLFRTITNGLAGTRMPGWEGLREETRWQLVAYLKSMAPTQPEAAPVPLGQDPGPHSRDLAKGRQLYADLGCAACHGTLGRANGHSAKALVDDWGQPSRPANLTHGWTLRAGATPTDLVTRLMTGVDGTPMPSYADAVAAEDLWQLAYYLRSLQEPVRWGWTVRAAPAAARPTSPTDPAWAAIPRTDVALWSNLYVGGQVVPAHVPWGMIQAVATPDALLLRIGWDDPTEDRGETPDRLALVLKPDTAGWQIGSLQTWPDPGSPALDLLQWSAAEDQVREAMAGDFDGPEGRGEASAGRSRWPTQVEYQEGRWWLMVTRPWHPSGLVPLRSDRTTPMALVAWDGGQGDAGRQRSVSTWLEIGRQPIGSVPHTTENTHDAP